MPTDLNHYLAVMEHCNHCGCDECIDVYYDTIKTLLQKLFETEVNVSKRNDRHHLVELRERLKEQETKL